MTIVMRRLTKIFLLSMLLIGGIALIISGLKGLDEVGTHKECYHIWTVDGRHYDTQYEVPDNSTQIMIRPSGGAYYIGYKPYWSGWKVLQYGVIDFERINCIEYPEE